MKLNKLIIGLCLLISTVSAQDKIDARFNYFGNISVSKLSQEGYTLNNYDHDNVDEKLRLSPYSKIGGQISVFYNKYSFMGQVLARKNHGKYDPEVTWFNAKYDFDSNLSVKLGRIQTTILLNSNSIDIDYIHLWAKAPAELYRLQGINSFDGVEFTYKNYIGEYDYTLMLTPYAKSKKKINTTEEIIDEAHLDNVSVVKVSVERDDLILQASYTKADLSLPHEDPALVSLRKGLEAYGNDMSRFSYLDKKFTAWTIGLKYDYKNIIFNSEYARMDVTSLLPDTSAYFALLGYRYNKFTPFYIYSRNNVDKEHFDTSNIVGPATLKDALDGVLYSTNTSQKTSSLGVRYDYKPGIAITAQVDRTSLIEHGRKGTLNKRGILEYELDSRKKPIYVYTLGVSFAF